MRNKNLSAARKNRNDEFYTQYVDIQKEMDAYLEYDPDTFRGKTVYCNCDNPYYSQFFRYFVDHFHRLGLKQVMATNYFQKDDADQSKRPECAAHRVIIRTVPEHLDTVHTPWLESIRQLQIQPENEWSVLNGDGDFRSPECMELLKRADMVITNPPFSLFREYVPMLMGHCKQFIIIGSLNGITYRGVFPFILHQQMWMGASRRNHMLFFNPFLGKSQDIHTFWYTNMQHGNFPPPLKLSTMEWNRQHNQRVINNTDSYLRYDNYDAIEVPYTSAIPSDYAGVMGVPISFMHRYCPDQFEIIGLTSEWLRIATKKYVRGDVQGSVRQKDLSDMNHTAVIRVDRLPPSTKLIYHQIGDYYYRSCYVRLLIRHRSTCNTGCGYRASLT